MRIWRRAPRAHSCGNCSKEIEAGEIELEIGEAKLSRCARCATEMFGEVPPELLEVPVPTRVSPPGFSSSKALAWRWRDVRQRQTGEPAS